MGEWTSEILFVKREREREHAKSAKDRRRIVYLKRIISEISLRDRKFNIASIKWSFTERKREGEKERSVQSDIDGTAIHNVRLYIPALDAKTTTTVRVNHRKKRERGAL